MQDKGRCGMFPAKGMEGAGDTTPLTKREGHVTTWAKNGVMQPQAKDHLRVRWRTAVIRTVAQGPPKRGLGGKNAVLGLKRAKKLQGVSNRGTVGLQQP